jgi:hypothetical protein
MGKKKTTIKAKLIKLLRNYFLLKNFSPRSGSRPARHRQGWPEDGKLVDGGGGVAAARVF